ncbi:hypothetical protein [Paraburkholderia unamae]|uniref:Uncharacterized protein n=1 Tax=Paraburkholderia unamae TaxID=219649 RepID=A0ABX5KY77_9BURK|nr:hypothetical protein [Paraburkholderia unamae]PVX85757.1 hypothetical protein C7402_103335 [Paraburkholderia unamae]
MFYNERRAQFHHLVYVTYELSESQLLAVVRAKDAFSVRYRAAALRHLHRLAPLDVTQGRPFAEARRLVRRHHDV